MKFNKTHYQFWNEISNENSNFRIELINKLKNLNYDAIFFEVPKYDKDKLMEIAIIDASHEFRNVIQNETPFKQYLNTNKDVVSFKNINNDTLLIVPTNKNANYTHLLSFLRTASDEQINSYFIYLGKMVLKYIDDGKPFYVSTHGLGIYYLHFRIGYTPRYYKSI